MKRDKTLMLEILLRIELSDENGIFIYRGDEPEMIDTLYHHIRLLSEAGYVTYKSSFGDNKVVGIYVSLNNQGYDYLESLEESENLSQTKSKLSQATNWTMTNVIAPLLVEYVKTLPLLKG